jgi:hypothetical protein
MLFSQQPASVALFAADPSVASVRIRFGVTDAQPAPWDGDFTVDGGESLGLRIWHPRPGDRVEGNTRFTVSTRPGPIFTLRPVEEEPPFPQEKYLWHAGVIADIKSASSARLTVRTKQGQFSFRLADIATGRSSPFLNGRVVVDRVATAQKVSSADQQADFATVLGGDKEVWTAWVAYRDKSNEVHARRFDGTNWGPIQTVTPQRADVFLVKLARDGQGRVWAIWSAQENGNWDLYGRSTSGDGKWSPVERITNAAGPDIYHNVATDAKGRLWVVWQGARNGHFDIFAKSLTGSTWSDVITISDAKANQWSPAIAADRAGNVYVGWDTYDAGNYDIRMRRFDGNTWSAPVDIASTDRFEANLSLVCDNQNRLWAAWNESGMQWGKDTGFLLRKQATGLYLSRWMNVAVWDGARWQQPAADIEKTLPAGMQGYNDLPTLTTDAAGRPWVFFRHRMEKFAGTPANSINHRATWELWGVAYDGNQWTQPAFVPDSQGRTDVRSGFALGPGGRLFGAWPTDNRDFQEYLFQKSDVFAGPLPALTAKAAAPQLQARTIPALRTWNTHDDEPGDLARIRGYEVRNNGKTYRIYRGDTHRHSEFSFDGNNDGSLLDLYRYALDAGGLDFISGSEHNAFSGPDLQYVNYLSQQAIDLFHVERAFVPIYGYERSVVYPNGHRNLLFAKRGIDSLPIPPEEQKGLTGAAMLYQYLRKNNGIAISHTSAGSMGTDWRDNDKELEPLVEIYQGDRVSAEYEGAPKSAVAGNPTMQPGGYRPLGYVWNAWAKGYKLGVQAASDHISTHISYACTLAEQFTKQGLIDAMRQRHSYGATDNIILDYRMDVGGKELIQGDITPQGGPVKLKVKIIGTRAVRQIDIIKSNTFAHTRQPMSKEVTFEYMDPNPGSGETYYYVRVIQVDDQMAWSSPIWVNSK